MDEVNPADVIDGLGGTGAVARLCGISSQAVSKWRKHGIPRAWIKYFQECNPEVFTNASAEKQAA